MDLWRLKCVLCVQNESRKLNHQAVTEEDRQLKLPANWESKRARLEWEVKVEEKKKVLKVFYKICSQDVLSNRILENFRAVYK